MNLKRTLRKAAKMLMMALVFSMIGVFGVTLPANPSVSSATVGKDYLLYVNTGTVAVPAWTLVGGQKSSDLGRTAESIKMDHKTSGGWGSTKAGLKNWSIDLSGLLLLQDAGIAALDYAFSNSMEVNIKLEYPDGTCRTGWASITDFSETNADDSAAGIKGTLEGNGPISDRTPSVTPLVATMSKAAAADKVFTIAPSDTTVSGVTDDGSALTVTTHYTYSGGTLTIKGTYLATVAIGVHTVVATTGDGAELTMRITITA